MTSKLKKSWQPQPDAADTVMGDMLVYCKSHLRVHRTGWCNVPVADKIPMTDLTTFYDSTEPILDRLIKKATKVAEYNNWPLYEPGRPCTHYWAIDGRLIEK